MEAKKSRSLEEEHCLESSGKSPVVVVDRKTKATAGARGLRCPPLYSQRPC